MNWDNVAKSNYISKLLREQSWLDRAEDLINAAKFIEPEIEQIWDSLRQAHYGQVSNIGRRGYLETYLMLMSFAFENILKAKIIAIKKIEFRNYINAKGRLPQELNSHDLYDLAQNLSINLDGEEDLLRRMSRSATWAGRYPVPIRSIALKGQRYSNGSIRNDSTLKKSDIEKVKNLMNKLLNVQ